MKWDIYKELKPIEREYYNKEIVNKKSIFEFDFKYLLLFTVMQTAVLILIASIGINQKIAIAPLLTLVGTLQKIIFGWIIVFTIVNYILIAFDIVNERKWLESLGYKTKREEIRRN